MQNFRHKSSNSVELKASNQDGGPHLDAVGLLDGEHFAVLLGSCDGHASKHHT